MKGGQVIGTTDATGATITDSGVSGRTELRAEDSRARSTRRSGSTGRSSATTIRLGRGFEYVPNAAAGVYAPIDRLFG